uniref:THAP domain containing, apoptosis associated protein 2 family protein n=1 Tax=Rhipicephalus zambeziensis TaxID=60191 RepID=A0A224Z9Z9_9ACAR
MPLAFSDFPNTRVVLDCTEIRIQKSSKLKAQRQTFSAYKHFNTFKALVGVTPDGYICFVPELWGGHVSDTEIVQKSNLLDHLQPGDGVMVDKGFRLDTIFPPTIKVYIPPFKMGSQLSAGDVIATRKIAGARIHVERVIRRIKEFHFLDRPVPITMLDIASKIFRTCAFLCNLQQPIISVKDN